MTTKLIETMNTLSSKWQDCEKWINEFRAEFSRLIAQNVSPDFSFADAMKLRMAKLHNIELSGDADWKPGVITQIEIDGNGWVKFYAAKRGDYRLHDVAYGLSFDPMNVGSIHTPLYQMYHYGSFIKTDVFTEATFDSFSKDTRIPAMLDFIEKGIEIVRDCKDMIKWLNSNKDFVAEKANELIKIYKEETTCAISLIDSVKYL